MGKVGEAVLFLMPCERAYLGNLEAKGVQLRPLNVLPALDLLPPDTTQQVSAASQAVQGTARVSCTCKQLATSEDMPPLLLRMALTLLLLWMRASHCPFWPLRTLMIGNMAWPSFLLPKEQVRWLMLLCCVQGWNGRSLETHGGAHALQGHLMEAVARDRSLQSLATDAFRSSVRA